MQAMTLESVRSFHNDLLLLVDAGFPLMLGPELKLSGSAAATCLQQIESRLSRARSRAESSTEDGALRTALEIDDSVSPEYRQAFLAWVATDGHASSLASLVDTGLAYDREWHRRRQANVFMLIWLLFSCAALIVLSTQVLPSVINMARDANFQSPLFESVAALLERRVYWLPAIPVSILLIYTWQAFKKPRGQQLDWQARFASRRAKAQQAAVLSQQGMSAAEIIQLWEAGSDRAEHEDSPPPAPLLKWAQGASHQREKNANAFALAAQIYASVQRLAGKQHPALNPSRWAVVVGALLTCLCGLLLFVPIIELLVFAAGAGR